MRTTYNPLIYQHVLCCISQYSKSSVSDGSKVRVFPNPKIVIAKYPMVNACSLEPNAQVVQTTSR